MKTYSIVAQSTVNGVPGTSSWGRTDRTLDEALAIVREELALNNASQVVILVKDLVPDPNTIWKDPDTDSLFYFNGETYICVEADHRRYDIGETYDKDSQLSSRLVLVK